MRHNKAGILVVVHLCGHEQECPGIDRLSKSPHLVRIGKTSEQFVREQTGWLEANLCPDCYNREKEINPGLKPNEPVTTERDIFAQAFASVMKAC